MNKTTEALKLAEEALEEFFYDAKEQPELWEALAAIREALAEQAPIQSWFGVGAAWPEKQDMISAAYGLSSWLSAALDDTKVCQEYKDAINAWFDAAMPVAPSHREINESIHERQVVIRTCVSLIREEMGNVPQLGATWLKLHRLIGEIEDMGDEPVKQEPYAYCCGFENTHPDGWIDCKIFRDGEFTTPLYAAPVSAKREWVELPDYEIVMLYAESPMCDSEMIDFARAVITAFKEKNK